MSRTLLGVSALMKRRPLIFNSIVYGSFYTGAEFAQQSYNRRYQLKQQQQKEPLPNTERFVAIGDASSKSNISTSIERTKTSQISSNYDWQQLQRYAIYGCFLAGPILHGCFYFFLSQSQRVKSEKLSYDWMVMARYALLGTFMYSPIYYYWYKWLDQIFRGTTMRIIMIKLVADQFILTPPLVVLFFISMSWMEKRNDVLHECKMKFVKTFQTSCMYWIPVQFVNFLLVPPAMRVLYVSVAAFCWVNILCYLKRLPLPTEAVQAEE